MIYGVKVIHTHIIEDDDLRFYEESILKVDANSFDEAYEKAAKYMQNAVCEYRNIYGKTVKTLRIESIDCFLAYDEETDVQEIYSSFSTDRSSLIEEEYYQAITSPCGAKELYQLRNQDLING